MIDLIIQTITLLLYAVIVTIGIMAICVIILSLAVTVKLLIAIYNSDIEMIEKFLKLIKSYNR